MDRRKKKQIYVLAMFCSILFVYLVGTLLLLAGMNDEDVKIVAGGLGRIAVIGITIWFSRVTGYSILSAVLWGLSTLIPYMFWISTWVLLKKYCKLENVKLTFFLGDKQ